MIRLYINDAMFEVPEGKIAKVIVDAIPDFVKHETVPAPTDLADVIRTALVGASSLFMNDLLFYVYGAKAPVIPLRADKLPYLTMAFVDMIIGTLQRYEVRIHADEIKDRDGVFAVKSFTAKPLPAGSQAALPPGDCGCGDSATAANPAEISVGASTPTNAPTQHTAESKR